MNLITLSGVGGSSNWLPLIFPLGGIVLAIKLGEYVFKYIKKRKLSKENRIINDQKLETNNQETGNGSIL